MSIYKTHPKIEQLVDIPAAQTSHIKVQRLQRMFRTLMRCKGSPGAQMQCATLQNSDITCFYKVRIKGKWENLTNIILSSIMCSCLIQLYTYSCSSACEWNHVPCKHDVSDTRANNPDEIQTDDDSETNLVCQTGSEVWNHNIHLCVNPYSSRCPASSLLSVQCKVSPPAVWMCAVSRVSPASRPVPGDAGRCQSHGPPQSAHYSSTGGLAAANTNSSS